MRSFVLILLAASFLLNAPSLNANGSENPAPRGKPSASEQKKQPNSKSKDAEQSSLSIDKVGDSARTEGKPTNANEQPGNIKQEGKDKTFMQRIIDLVLNPNWVQVLALIVTIGVMIWTARRQLRAYVAVTPENLVGPNVPSHPVRYKYRLINHGKTPAYKLTDTALVDIFPYPLPPNFQFPNLPSPHGRLVLHPRESTYFGEARAVRCFSPEEATEVADGTRRRIYIFGVVEYEDVFGKSHTTQFCHSIVGHLGMLPFLHNAPNADGQRFNSESADQHDYTD